MHIYRDILKQAFLTTWTHKELWIFGLFAGLLNTGSVIDTIIQLIRDSFVAQTAPELFVRAIPGLKSFLDYLSTISLLEATRQVLTGGALLFVFVLLLLFALNGQANLFTRLKRNRKHFDFWHPQAAVLARLLALNAISLVCLALLHVFSATVLQAFADAEISLQILATFALLVTTIPFALLVGCLTLFAMIEIVTKNKTLHRALADASSIAQHHLTAVVEVAILLFLVGLLGTLTLVGALILLAIPFLFLFLLSLTLQSLVLWMVVLVATSVSGLLLILAFGGWLTSFVYAAWFETYKKFASRTAVISKLERVAYAVRAIV